MNDFDYVVDDDGDDDDDDDLVSWNHFLDMESHRKMRMIEVQMDRMVRLKPQITVDDDSVVYNTYRYNHLAMENSPFDTSILKINLEIHKKTSL